jgi:hypothetical protein
MIDASLRDLYREVILGHGRNPKERQEAMSE